MSTNTTAATSQSGPELLKSDRTSSTARKRPSRPATSVADSVAVNVPLTRSTSPAALSTSPPNSTNGSVNVEKLAQETSILEKQDDEADERIQKHPHPRRHHGALCAHAYPQRRRHRDTRLDDEAARASFAAFMVVSDDLPRYQGKEAGMTTVGEFDTVESYCRYFNWFKLPAKLERNSNFHMFKSGIKPMWEDEAGAMAWYSSVKNSTRVTRSAARSSACDPRSIVSNWTRSKDDVDIGRKLVKLSLCLGSRWDQSQISVLHGGSSTSEQAPSDTYCSSVVLSFDV
ncbi:hypothetical protein BGW80DRAFT_1565996 [Lactifluus volemus]|nr:hypothetical protein BGW80DRAFT_1565996 [Lactifluus volemus]